LRIRLLGDRVLQRVAWKIADQLGWHDTPSTLRLISSRPTHSSRSTQGWSAR
jgi:hypothetical protein